MIRNSIIWNDFFQISRCDVYIHLFFWHRTNITNPKSEYWWFWLVQVPITFIALGAWNSEKFDVLSGVFLGITIASIPANLSSMVRRFHDAGLSTKQCLKKLSYAVAPFLFAVNLMTKIDPFSSFAVVLLIALLFSAVSFFLLFIILIGDSVYEDEEEE